MDVKTESVLINAEYNEKCKDKIYPFISSERITLIEAGLYKKKSSKYYGVGVIKDNILGTPKVVLMGYFDVPFNMIVIPNGLKLSEGQISLIKKYEDLGYIKNPGFPRLKVKEFSKDTKEYIIAMENNKQFNLNLKNDISNNESRKSL
jgi:hypothetical protein